MKRLRVGVMGQGRSGFNIHVKWLQKDPEKWEIVAVADEHPERMTDSAEAFGATTFSDYKDLIANAGDQVPPGADEDRIRIMRDLVESEGVY